MKIRLIVLLLMLSLLCGCRSALVPNEYTVIAEHSDTQVGEQSDAVPAESYEELKYAILSFVEDGVTHGLIRSYRYDGDVTEDITDAAYEIWKNDPLGAYLVEYITTDCNLLLSYYEIHVEITYRQNAVPAEEIGYVRGKNGAEEAIATALQEGDERLTLRISAFSDAVDCAKLVQEYCAANPETVMEAPEVTVAVYPDNGSTRIADVTFTYSHTEEERNYMKQAAGSVLNSAAAYVRFRNEDHARAEMLVSYLLGRFEYVEGQSDTPIYSLLCEGIGNSRTFAEVFQILCDRVGINCRIVSGYLDGESYSWNILEIGKTCHHVDLMRYVREGLSDLVYYADADMERYSWDREAYPVCGLPESTLENPAAPEEEGEAPEDPAEPDTPDAPENPEDTDDPDDPEAPADPEIPEELPPEGTPEPSAETDETPADPAE